jgi:hypothetical protein
MYFEFLLLKVAVAVESGSGCLTTGSGWVAVD